MIKKIMLICTLLAGVMASCKKDNVTVNPQINAPVFLEFDHTVGNEENLILGNTYKNSLNQDFTVDILKYYISNIAFTKADGSVYTVPQDSSYFLIDASDKAKCLVSLNIPEGDYIKVRFLVGVDSLRNTMDVSKRTGVLDPEFGAAGMYWTWNSGYIFFNMEGSSPVAVGQGNKYRYHIGGFGGYNTPTINNIKEVEMDLSRGGTAKVRQGRKSQIHFFVDVLKVFGGESQIDIAANGSSVMSLNDASKAIANNYRHMFSHDHTHN